MDKNSLYEAVKRFSESQHFSNGLIFDQSIAQYNSLLAAAKGLYKKRADIQGLLSWNPNTHLNTTEFEDSIVRLKSALELAALRSSAKLKPQLSLSQFGIPDLNAFKAEISTMREPDLLSCVFMDLDNFKAVNDTHNHEVGDDVIKDAIRITQLVVMGKGKAYHRSGDEILILLPNFDSVEACAVAERIRRTIEEHDFPVIGQGLVTATLGVSTCPTFCALRDVEVSADRAAMEAKTAGKNQVVHSNTVKATHRNRSANQKELRSTNNSDGYLDPVLELMHFGFDDVGKNERGAYVRVGKDFTGEVFKAAILEFRLKPIRDAVPWVEARAHIVFKDQHNQRTRVGAGVWHGRDQPVAPIRSGETLSLILTGGYSVSDSTEYFSTYEHGPRGEEDQRIERPLEGDNVRVCVGIIAEYMSVPRSDNAWYFQLYRLGDQTPSICTIKPTAFDKRLRRSNLRTSM
jgi:diguanylate cyclase (GGDEF)-like protein